MPTSARKLRAERPICIDLFAGAGGLSLGFEQAGFDVVAAVEIDPIHAATHVFNFPGSTVLCSSVTSLTGDEIRKAANISQRRIDVVVGGPPCQGFSLIGHRVLEDPRNALVFHFLRLVKELRPRYFVMENVPGMVTGGHVDLFKQLLVRFEKLGYRVQHRVLNAAHFGVPQNRARVFVIGSAPRNRVVGLPDPQSVLRHTDGSARVESRLPLCPSVEDAIGDLPDIDDFESLIDSDELVMPLPPASQYASRLRSDVRDPNDFSYHRERPEKVLTGCLRAAHTDLSRRRFSATPQGDTEPVSRFYRLPLKGVANTLRSGTASDRGAFTSPRPIHSTRARCISVREAARLHSFPDWFWFHQTKWHGFRQIGNSVPPLLARAVARELIQGLNARVRRPSEQIPMGSRDLVRFNMVAAAAHFGVDARVIPQRTRKLT